MTEVVETSEGTGLAETLVQGAIDTLPEDPQERAEERLRRLKASFAASLAIVGEMYRDKDWEHLTREDGTSYSSLPDLLTDVLDVSVSMARRYVQGARGFFQPLSEITVAGTRIEITSGDVASLGEDGLQDAVDSATENLQGVEDPDESSEIISDAVSDAKERKQSSRDIEEEEEWGEPIGDEGMTFASSDSEVEDDLDGLPDDDSDSDDDGPAPVALEDPLDTVMEGAQRYETEEDYASLPEEVKDAARALSALSSMDPREVAKAINYENRGVVAPTQEAISNATRLKSLVEASPWYMARVT